jgi:hypothetical protein
MFGALLLAALMIQEPTPATGQAPNTSSPTPPAPIVAVKKALGLSEVKRIYVESFGTDEASKQLESMVVSSITESKRFIVTENKNKADAILKGTAMQRTSQEVHAYGSGTSVGTAAGSESGSISGSGGSISGSSVGGFISNHAGINDSSVNTETIDRAQGAVRLVNTDGDVIWTTTQESKGAKYRGATADVADKMIKQLIRDVEKLEKPEQSTGSASSTTSKH